MYIFLLPIIQYFTVATWYTDLQMIGIDHHTDSVEKQPLPAGLEFTLYTSFILIQPLSLFELLYINVQKYGFFFLIYDKNLPRWVFVQESQGYSSQPSLDTYKYMQFLCALLAFHVHVLCAHANMRLHVKHGVLQLT